MTHFRVILGHHKKDDDIDIIEKNYYDPENECDPQPFGFDYMCEIETYKSEDFKDENISEIIDSNGEKLWWSDGMPSPESEMSFEEALKKVKKNEYITLYDTHL